MVALRYALTLAKQFDANLTLLHVLEEPYSSNTEVEPGAEGSLDPEKGNEERALALLEEDLRSEHWNCRSCFRIGTASEQIVHEAENIKANLVVMSSHKNNAQRPLKSSGSPRRFFNGAIKLPLLMSKALILPSPKFAIR
jgi:nucleotide-binding universal stress UspA family protein